MHILRGAMHSVNSLNRVYSQPFPQKVGAHEIHCRPHRTPMRITLVSVLRKAQNVFIRAHLTLLERGFAIDICSSVRLSVCLSNALIVTKRDNHLSICQHHTIEQCFLFLETKFRGPEFRSSPPNECVKDRYPCRKRNVTNNDGSQMNAQLRQQQQRTEQ